MHSARGNLLIRSRETNERAAETALRLNKAI